MKSYKSNRKLWIIFIIYLIINVFLVVIHEPWRDEIHSWLMAKNYGLFELIRESRFDGHPILWQLILMPVAKLNAPIITLNIISLIFVSIATGLFLFKTKLPTILKIISTFSVPFTYTFSSISRNYALVILLMMIIGVTYDKRHQKPILYSIIISLLIHSHVLAWGLVAGLTITFHFDEIINFFKKKNTVSIRKIMIGLIIIVINTILVVLELYGVPNPNYITGKSLIMLLSLIIIFFTLLIALIITINKKSCIREYIILACGLLFQAIIYIFVYSTVIYQRFILIFAFLLFYIILISKTKSKNDFKRLNCILYSLSTILGIAALAYTMVYDIFKPYSGAQEMANYINNNLPDNTTIYIDSELIGQSMIPYLKTSKLYDIAYNEYVTTANRAYDYDKIYEALEENTNYTSNYLIVSNDVFELKYEKIYKTKKAIAKENFTLYYIP